MNGGQGGIVRQLGNLASVTLEGFSVLLQAHQPPFLPPPWPEV